MAFYSFKNGPHLKMAPKQVLSTWGSFMDKVLMKQRPQSQCSEEICVYLKYKERVPSRYYIREEIATFYFHPHKSCRVMGHSLNPFILNVTAVFWVSYISLKLSQSMKVLDAYKTNLTELVKDFFFKSKTTLI